MPDGRTAGQVRRCTASTTTAETVPTVDYALIYALEVELGIVEQPKTLEAVHGRLLEIEEWFAGEPLPNAAIAEWNVLAARLDDLKRARHEDLERERVLRAVALLR